MSGTAHLLRESQNAKCVPSVGLVLGLLCHVVNNIFSAKLNNTDFKLTFQIDIFFIHLDHIA